MLITGVCIDLKTAIKIVFLDEGKIRPLMGVYAYNDSGGAKIWLSCMGKEQREGVFRRGNMNVTVFGDGIED